MGCSPHARAGKNSLKSREWDFFGRLIKGKEFLNFNNCRVHFYDGNDLLFGPAGYAFPHKQASAFPRQEGGCQGQDQSDQNRRNPVQIGVPGPGL